MTQAGLFGREEVGTVRDELDRHFTPYPLALVMCERIAEHIVPPRIIIEPSVGGGSIARAAKKVWPEAWIIGVDLDPKAEGRHVVDEFILGDWIEVGADLGVSVDLVLGNPPFTGKTAIAHVKTARAVAPAVALLLPWGPLGGVAMWDPLMNVSGPSHAWPVAGPRPWPQHVRETAVYMWRDDTPGRHGTFVRWLPRWKN